MKAKALMLSLCLAGGALGGSQVVLAVDIVIAPPAPRVEVVPAPRPGYVWAPGYWDYRGAGHVWIPGRWIVERRGFHWVPEHWVQRGAGWRLEPGHWVR